MTVLSSKDCESGLFGEQGVAGVTGVMEGGTVRQELGGCWLALLGGGVKFGIVVDKSSCGEACSRGFRRRVISCNS